MNNNTWVQSRPGHVCPDLQLIWFSSSISVFPNSVISKIPIFVIPLFPTEAMQTYQIIFSPLVYI